MREAEWICNSFRRKNENYFAMMACGEGGADEAAADGYFLCLQYELLSTIRLNMRPRHSTLTPQELEIMKLVWERDSATVRDVYEALLERRKIAYTTVMTMMKILESKGYLTKRRQERAYVYRAAHPKEKVIGKMIREFMDRVFNGSAEPLLVHLVKGKHIREQDLEKVRKMLEESK